MKIHRFYNDEIEFNNILEINKKSKSEKESEVFNQIYNVLKLKEEESIILFKNGEECLYKITAVNNKLINLSLIKKYPNLIDEFINSKPEINLYLSNIKKDKLEDVVQKAVELGVKNIIIIISERTQYKTTNRARLEKIISEATEQSGRGELAIIKNMLSLKEALEYTKPEDLNYLCSITQNNKNSLTPKCGKINVWIGPEGGWTENEENTMLNKGFEVLNLGKTILRAETAAISAIAKII